MDEPEFSISFPCCIIESRDGRDVFTIEHDGVNCIALFTDAQLAEGYEWQHHLRGEPRAFEDADAIRDYLTALPGRFTHVVIDPRGDHHGYKMATIDLLNLL